VRASGEVLGGVVVTKVTLGSLLSVSATGFGVEPGFGVEIPIARRGASATV
jgi:hypothetical protein